MALTRQFHPAILLLAAAILTPAAPDRSLAESPTPLAPQLRLARGEDGKATLAFSPVAAAKTYAIRVAADTGRTEMIENVEAANYTVHGLMNGYRYRFAVSALVDGRRSPWSNELSATPVDQPDWQTLREAFTSRNPTKNSNPFTMVRGNETEAELRAIIRAAYDAGFEGVTLHPYGYEDYLGPGQWNRWKIILDQARRLGLAVWQQDDRNYPSGFAAGKVVAAHPEFGRTRLVQAAQHSLTGPQKALSFDIQPLLQGRDFLVSVSAYPENGEPLDLTNRVSHGKLTWDVPPGKWRLFVVKAVWCGPMPVADTPTPYPFIDLMNPRAVDAYIQTIYGATFDQFGPDFGRTFKGFFSDEAPVDFSEYTPDFLARFEKSKGYSIRKWLPSVTNNLSPRDKQIRFDYRDFIREQNASVFFGRCRQWCRKHGIQLIGHVIEDHQQDMRRLEMLDFPGLDNVFGQWYDPDPDVYWRMPRMVSSVAHYAGSRNDVALIEHFAATGWRTGLSEMKRMMDWSTVMGINQVVPCGLSTNSPPDWEVTPDFWLHGRNPQWSTFPAYQAAANRMTMLMRGGRHVAPAIVLDTTESRWVQDGPDLGWQHGARDDLWRSCAAMSQAHVDFDLIPYYVVADKARTAINGSRLHIAKEDYRAVIVPGVEHIPAAVVERLRAFHDAGGIVVAIGRVPSASCNGQEDDRVRAAVAAIWGANGSKTERAAITNYDGLATCLTKFDVPDVRIPSHPKNLLYCHRQLHGKNLYFFANTGPDPIATTIELHGANGLPTLWDPVTGTVSEPQTYSIADGILKLSLDFGEYESMFVVVDPDAKPHASPAATRVSSKSITLPNHWQTRNAAAYHRLFSTELKLPAEWPLGSPARLELQGASQILRVRVNGHQIGKQFCAPYRFEVGQHLRAGANQIEIERIGRYSSPVEVPNMGQLSFTNDDKAAAPCQSATLTSYNHSP